MSERAMTVLGPVEKADLGWVQPHEHLTIDNRVHVSPRDEMAVDTPVRVTNLGYVRTSPRALADNIVMDDDGAALEDLKAYAAAGGRTIVELTPCAMGRDLDRLRWFSESAGVHVVASTAYYVYQGHKGHVAGRSVADIASEFVRDLTSGSIRCGAIGEIGVSAEPFDDELKVVQASLEAQSETGAPMFIHVTTVRPVPRLLDFLAALGKPLERVVLCHMDYDIRDLAPHRRALDMGMTVELDVFGYPGWSNANFLHLPTDAERAEALLQLASEGWGSQLLMSHDVCQKMQLTSRGGFGYAHILTRVVPLLKTLGASDEFIEQMGVKRQTDCCAGHESVAGAPGPVRALGCFGADCPRLRAHPSPAWREWWPRKRAPACKATPGGARAAQAVASGTNTRRWRHRAFLAHPHRNRVHPTITTVADTWKQIGVEVNIQPMELAAWLDKNNRNDFDLIVSNRGFRGDPIDILMPAFHSGGVDNQGYTNPQVDTWLEQASKEPDRTKRRDLYLQVQKQVMTDAVWSFLWVPAETDAMQKYVQGYDHVAFDGFRDLMAATWIDKG